MSGYHIMMTWKTNVYKKSEKDEKSNFKKIFRQYICLSFSKSFGQFLATTM